MNDCWECAFAWHTKHLFACASIAAGVHTQRASEFIASNCLHERMRDEWNGMFPWIKYDMKMSITDFFTDVDFFCATYKLYYEALNIFFVEHQSCESTMILHKLNEHHTSFSLDSLSLNFMKEKYLNTQPYRVLWKTAFHIRRIDPINMAKMQLIFMVHLQLQLLQPKSFNCTWHWHKNCRFASFYIIFFSLSLTARHHRTKIKLK